MTLENNSSVENKSGGTLENNSGGTPKKDSSIENNSSGTIAKNSSVENNSSDTLENEQLVLYEMNPLKLHGVDFVDNRPSTHVTHDMLHMTCDM